MAWYGMVWYGMVWYGMVWYNMVWYGMVLFGFVLYALVGGGVMFQNVLEDSDQFHGGWYICNYSVYSSPPPESEIETELEGTWEASEVDLELVWT